PRSSLLRPVWATTAIAAVIIMVMLLAWPRDPRQGARSQPAPPATRTGPFEPPSWLLVATTGLVRATSFSNDGRFLAAAEEGVVRVWDVERRVAASPILGNAGVYHDVQFAPDTTKILVVGDGGVARLLGWPEGEPLALPPPNAEVFRCAATDPHGRFMA